MSDLRTDFKDDVLNITTNEKRKYRMINNADGTVSFEDVTDYVQQGDTFGATEVNQITEKVNSCLTRQDVVDNLESTATDLPLSANTGREIKEFLKARGVAVEKNTTDWTDNSSRVTRSGNTICVYINVTGIPVNQKTILTGLPKPLAVLYAYSTGATPSKIALGIDGTLFVASAGTSSSVPIVFEMTYQSNE